MAVWFIVLPFKFFLMNDHWQENFKHDKFYQSNMYSRLGEWVVTHDKHDNDENSVQACMYIDNIEFSVFEDG